MVKGSKHHELEADDVPASELWKIYGTLRFVELVHELLPQVLHQVEVLRGDGTVGTVIKVTFPPGERARHATTSLLLGNPGVQTYSEEFVKIDNENRVKEAAVIEGDLLTLGFTTYLTRFQIIDKGPSSSVIASTVEYEYDDGRPELEAAASTAPLAAAAERLVQYVKEQMTTTTTAQATAASCFSVAADSVHFCALKFHVVLRPDPKNPMCSQAQSIDVVRSWRIES